MNKKQTIKLNENHIRNIVENVIKEVVSDREYDGSYGLIDILEENGLIHDTAMALINGMEIYGHINRSAFSDIAKYIKQAEIDNHNWTMEKDYWQQQ